MRRFRDYYRQFEEMPPEEISLELRARRDDEKRRALARVEPLDLSASGWYEPPHPEAINAATFALRRALNAYPDRDADALRRALAERHGAAPEQIAVGHGAGELLRALFAALLAPGDEVVVAWPGWQLLPQVVAAAGGRAVPTPSTPASLMRTAGASTRAVVLTSPGDPDGVVYSRGALLALRESLPEPVLLVVDEALGEFARDGEDAAGLVGELPGLVVVRSFSKGHALAGLRAGAALGPAAIVGGLGASGGLGAPAQAAATWALSPRGLELAERRRATAQTLHLRLDAGLAGSPLAAAPASTPFAWISSEAEDGAALAARLAARQVFVAPGGLWNDERGVRAALRGTEAVDRLVDALLAAD
jgi:histidinol-phosphate/aromatic aminotransferase/cobyric acid decarboxylase-like protein